MNRTALRDLSKADAVMARLIKRVGPCTLQPSTPVFLEVPWPFAALVETIAYQQLTGKAAATIFSRVKALFPQRSFPTPEDLLEMPDDRFRGAGLSRSKIAAIKDIAAKTLEGMVPAPGAIERMDDSEILSRLTKIRGVGPWTVEMLLMFKLGRPDVLPVTDYGVRKGFAQVYGRKDLPKPSELLEFGERWRPHRTTASWYLWRSLDSPDL